MTKSEHIEKLLEEKQAELEQLRDWQAWARVKFAELERERDSAAWDAHNAESNIAKLREATKSQFDALLLSTTDPKVREMVASFRAALTSAPSDETWRQVGQHAAIRDPSQLTDDGLPDAAHMNGASGPDGDPEECDGGGCGHPCSKCGEGYGSPCIHVDDRSVRCPGGERRCTCSQDRKTTTLKKEPSSPPEERFFLMSVGGNYWCPGASGYTSTVLCAGTFSRQEASARVAAGSGMVVMISMEEIIGNARLDFDPLVLMAALRRGPTP